MLEIINLKIAIPTFSPGGLDSKINPHFGKCDMVTFVTVEDNTIGDTNIVKPTGPHSCASLPQLFVQHGADTCIVGGIGGRPAMFLQQSRIKTYSIGQDLIQKPVKDVVDFFLRKELKEITSGTCNDPNQ